MKIGKQQKSDLVAHFFSNVKAERINSVASIDVVGVAVVVIDAVVVVVIVAVVAKIQDVVEARHFDVERCHLRNVVIVLSYLYHSTNIVDIKKSTFLRKKLMTIADGN
jgi:hypothetical protein